MDNSLAEYINSQGNPINELQLKSLRKSEEYIDKNKILELFDVSIYL